MRVKYILGVIAITLAGCQGTAAVIHDKHTGLNAAVSQMFPAKTGLLYNLNVVAGYSKRKGYNIATSYSSTGLGWMFFREAWSYGKQFDYKVTGENIAGCGGASCTMVETGGIHMDEADFLKAATEGFEFKLVGQKGSVEGKVPARAFQQALEQMKNLASEKSN